MRPLPVEPLSAVPAFVAGVAVVRGVAVPVVDVARLMGVAAASPTRFITIRTSAGVAALAAGDVLGVQGLSPDVLASTPPLLREVAGGALAQLASLDEQLLLVLESSRVVPGSVWNLVQASDARP